jgi:hypothetical protein
MTIIQDDDQTEIISPDKMNFKGSIFSHPIYPSVNMSELEIVFDFHLRT